MLSRWTVESFEPLLGSAWRVLTIESEDEVGEFRLIEVKQLDRRGVPPSVPIREPFSLVFTATDHASLPQGEYCLRQRGDGVSIRCFIVPILSTEHVGPDYEVIFT